MIPWIVNKQHINKLPSTENQALTLLNCLTTSMWFMRICGLMVQTACLKCGRSRVQTKDYKIGICCFSAKHGALRRKSKDWLTWNQDKVFECGDMSIRRLVCCFSWSSTKQTSSLSHCKLTCSHHDIAEKLLSWC